MPIGKAPGPRDGVGGGDELAARRADLSPQAKRELKHKIKAKREREAKRGKGKGK